MSAAGCALTLGLSAAGIAIIGPQLTPWLESNDFRHMLDRQTSKGLHFDGSYSPIERTGFWTARAEAFQASEGTKAMKTLEAAKVSAAFNPWGLFLRRWQLDDVRIRRGRVEVQTYEPKPDNKPSKPWYAIFLPDRIHLSRVVCDVADLTWQMEGKPGGIRGTSLTILPYGRDFEYFAEGGELRSGGLVPPLSTSTISILSSQRNSSDWRNSC